MINQIILNHRCYDLDILTKKYNTSCPKELAVFVKQDENELIRKIEERDQDLNCELNKAYSLASAVDVSLDTDLLEYVGK